MSQVSRFRKLAALVSSDNGNEALSAARRMVSMLGDGGSLEVVDKGSKGGGESDRERQLRDREVWLGALEAGLQRRVAAVEAREAALSSREAALRLRPGDPGWESTEAGRWALEHARKLLEANLRQMEGKRGRAVGPEPAAAAAAMTQRAAKACIEAGWRKFASAQYGGMCRGECGVRIEQGSPCWWKRGAGIICEGCAERLGKTGELPE